MSDGKSPRSDGNIALMVPTDESNRYIVSALAKDGSMLSVIEFIRAANYPIDTFMFDRFWASLKDNMRIYVDDALIQWMGYDAKEKYNRKQSLLKILNRFELGKDWFELSNEEYREFRANFLLPAGSKKIDVKNGEIVPNLLQSPGTHLSEIFPDPSCNQGAHKVKHLLLTQECLKEVMMIIDTQKARQVRKHYIALEKLMLNYTIYQSEFNTQVHRVHEIKFKQDANEGRIKREAAELQAQQCLQKADEERVKREMAELQALQSLQKAEEERVKREMAELHAQQCLQKAEEERKQREIEDTERKRIEARREQLPADITRLGYGQYVYVMTTINMAAKCRFKVGGSCDSNHVYSRYMKYTTGRDTSDPNETPFFCLLEKVHDFRIIEHQLKSQFNQFVVVNPQTDKDTEIYMMDWPLLEKAIISIIRRSRDCINEFNDEIVAPYKEHIRDRPMVMPPTINVEQRLGIVIKPPIINMETMGAEQKEEKMRELFAVCICGRSKVSRKDFGDYVSSQNYTFNKNAWDYMRQLFGDHITYR